MEERMKIAIIGSRTFEAYDLLVNALKEYNITEIVSGGANGADSLAEKYAKENNISAKIFYPDWNNINVDGAVIKTNYYGKK